MRIKNYGCEDIQIGDLVCMMVYNNQIGFIQQIDHKILNDGRNQTVYHINPLQNNKGYNHMLWAIDYNIKWKKHE